MAESECPCPDNKDAKDDPDKTPPSDPQVEQLRADQLKEIQKLLLGGATLNPDSPPATSDKQFTEWGSFECEVDSRNRQIHCPRCPSKICLADVGKLVHSEMKMAKYKVDGNDEEVVTVFWLLGSLMSFENIGVTKVVDNIKFLSCADCEVGPLGWHDITNLTKFYIAADRVRYLDS